MKKIAILLVFLFSFAVISCKTGQKKPKTKKPTFNNGMMQIYHMDGSMKGQGKYKNKGTKKKPEYIKDGKWTFYADKSGKNKKTAEGSFAENVKEGVWKTYYNGKQQTTGTYVKGKKSGPWTYFHMNGRKESTGKQVDGKKEGPWKFYSPQGQLQHDVMYKDDKKNGPSTSYYPNGKVALKTAYLNNKEQGLSTTYWPNGRVKQQGRNDEGNKTGMWVAKYPNGKMAMKGAYRKNKPNGVWSTYAQGGWLTSQGRYDNGKQVGTWIYKNRRGQITHRAVMKKDDIDYVKVYVNGRKVGEGKVFGTPPKIRKNGWWKEFYPNGQVKEETVTSKGGQYIMNNKTGKFKLYYPNGKLKAVGEYMNNKYNGDWVFYNQDGSKDTANSGYYMLGKKMKMGF